jgi:flagellar assembly protein FliH
MRRQPSESATHQATRLLRQQDGVPAVSSARPIVWPGAGQDPALALIPGVAQELLVEPDHSPFSQAQDVQRQVESALRQGRTEGEAIGAQRAGQRLDPMLAELGAVLKDLAQLRPRLRMELEEDTVKLALVIARRVLHRELATDPEAILGLVKAAFHKLNAREAHRLRLAPQDAAVLDEFRGRLNLPDALEITRDGSLPRGSAVFETSRGELDASVDTQLSEIERGLTDIMRRRIT